MLRAIGFITLLCLLGAQDVDLSTPKAAARSLFLAVERGDEPALREMFFVADPDDATQRELVAAYAHLIIQGKRLSDAGSKKFPGAADALAQGIVSAEELKRVDEAKVEETGDTAKLTLDGRMREMRFRRTGNQWRLVVAETENATEKNLSEQIELVREFAGAIGETVDEIDAGKFATVQEAEVALQSKANAVMMRAVKANPPATSAAPQAPPVTTTAPASAPIRD